MEKCVLAQLKSQPFREAVVRKHDHERRARGVEQGGWLRHEVVEAEAEAEVVADGERGKAVA